MRKIFLETSFFSFLDASDALSKQVKTRALYDLLRLGADVETFTSTSVLEEINNCHEPKRQFMMDRVMESCKVLPITEEDNKLRDVYFSDGVLTAKSLMDLLHVAVAVRNECAVILSWNMKHLANFKTVERINKTNFVRGLIGIQIMTPHNYLMEEYL